MYWAAIFSMFSIASGLFGFGGIAGPASWLAEVLCVVFAGLAILCVAAHFVEPPHPQPP